MSSELDLELKCREGEGFKVEFKEKLANLDREIVAFANASGGEIFLGVRDNGDIKGIEITNKLLSQIQDIAHNCDPSIHIELHKNKQHSVLVIFVQEGENKPYKCSDGFFLRVGPNAQKLKRNEIVQFINNVGKTHFDETYNQKFEFSDNFSSNAFQTYLKHCGFNLKASEEDILLSLNLAKKTPSKLLITHAGVLFFAKNPQSFYPEAFITAVKYKNNDRFSIIDKKDFMGSPISQIEESLAFVIRHMNLGMHIDATKTAARQECYDYPPIAIREAIINAVTHRDYLYDGSHIYIHMYPDHIDIENPGGLYPGITIEDLGRRSVRRNRLIADLLHRARYIERVGSGFDRMREALRSNKNPALEVSATNFFSIRFFKRAQDFNLQKLTTRQLAIYYSFLERKQLTKRDIALGHKISEDTAMRELKILMKLDFVQKQGEGKATYYVLRSEA
jgi:ATP-dependent DNA helicase RecG